MKLSVKEAEALLEREEKEPEKPVEDGEALKDAKAAKLAEIDKTVLKTEGMTQADRKSTRLNSSH